MCVALPSKLWTKSSVCPMHAHSAHRLTCVRSASVISATNLGSSSGTYALRPQHQGHAACRSRLVALPGVLFILSVCYIRQRWGGTAAYGLQSLGSLLRRLPHNLALGPHHNFSATRASQTASCI